MSLDQIPSWFMAFVTLAALLWAIVQFFTNRKDAHDERTQRLIEDIQKEIVAIQVEQGILREQIRNMPDQSALREAIQEMEERLEKRLDAAVKRFEDVLSSAAKFRCPHELGGA
jgi:hypothetical protein